MVKFFIYKDPMSSFFDPLLKVHFISPFLLLFYLFPLHFLGAKVLYEFSAHYFNAH